MPEMTDPQDALKLFQRAFREGILELRRCSLEPDLWVHVDRVNNHFRLTYAYLDGRTVTAFAVFVQTEPHEGLPCFQVGYAVPPKFRKQGKGTAVVKSAIAEMEHGFSRTAMTSFYIEAIVGRDNVASQRVAETVLLQKGRETVDSVSGKPALAYMRKMGA